jgi:hypothetical protein
MQIEAKSEVWTHDLSLGAVKTHTLHSASTASPHYRRFSVAFQPNLHLFIYLGVFFIYLKFYGVDLKKNRVQISARSLAILTNVFRSFPVSSWKFRDSTLY